MIYSIILKQKFRNILKTLVFIILIAFSATLYSCQTVYTEEYIPEKIIKNEDVKLIEATTKNDSIISLANCRLANNQNYNVSSKIVLLEKTDTTYFKDKGRTAFKIKKSLSELNLNDLKYITVEKSKIDWFATSGLILTVIVLAAIIGYSVGMHGAFGAFGGH